MKLATFFTAFLSSLVLFIAAPAFAEVEPVEETVIPGAASAPAETTGMPAADPAPSEMAPRAEAQPRPPARQIARAGRDARRCLDLATNTEIIKCAEKYR
jgi:hypothetical protein